MGRRTDRRRMTQVSFADEQISTRTRAQTVAVEEPLEIRVAGTSLTVTMRLPGDDMELVHGLLLGEGLIHHRDDLLVARYCADTDTMNVIDVTLAEGPRPLPINAQRTLVMHGGCGLCGKASIDAVTASVGAIEIRGEVDVRVVRSLHRSSRRSSRPSVGPGAPTRPDCSLRPARPWWSARMSGGTTRSTRCWGGR